MKIHSMDHLNLTVSNLEESINWYQKIFGFEVVEGGQQESGPWAIIRSGDAMLCMYEDSNRVHPIRVLQDERLRHMIYHWGFRVVDKQEWLKTVEKHQLQLEYGGENKHNHSSSWYVSDPTGYRIEVAVWNDNIIRFDT